MAGLIFDVLEEQIVEDPGFVHEISRVLCGSGVRLAIDNFSGSMLSRGDLKLLPFEEIKINPISSPNATAASPRQ